LARSEHRRITTVHYHYDALGRRYRKRSEQSTAAGEQQPVQDTFYGWDGDRLVTTQTGQDSSTVIYEPESFVPLLRVDRTGAAQGSSTRLLHYHCNHLGTPLALIDAQQPRIVWHAELNPWGNRLEEFNPEGIAQHIRMQGQHHDEETGLFYNRYRYYVPHAGRYLTQDPVGLGGGPNLYSYAEGNPLRYADPRGNNPVAGAIEGAEIGTAILPGWGTLIGAGIGALGGYLIADQLGNLIFNRPSKTPNAGAPGSCHVNPGSGQERQFGNSGKPEYDIDWDHDHGQGVPHGHNWDNDPNGVPIRGPGLPISTWPVGRGPGG